MMSFDIFPSYVASIYYIVLLYIATCVTDIFLASLIIVLFTRISLKEKDFAYWVVKLSGLLPLVIFLISIKFIKGSNIITANPLIVLSYLSAFIGVVLLNYDTEENTALNISRNIALNFIIIKSSYMNAGFLTTLIISCVIFYLQFLTIKIMPRLNLFEKARRSIILSVFISFVPLLTVLLWEFYIRR